MRQAEAAIQAGTDQGVSGRVQFLQSAETEPLQITGDGRTAPQRPQLKTEMFPCVWRTGYISPAHAPQLIPVLPVAVKCCSRSSEQ